MDTTRLKEQTAAEHDRVEQSMTLMQPGLTVAEYVSALQRLYGFVRGWEEWAAHSTCENVQTLLQSRRRSTLLLADLDHLSANIPTEAYGGPALRLESCAEALGAMYVMEGSTLGGQYIARHVEAVLGLEPGVGNAFFRGYGNATGSMWREFKEALVGLPDDMEQDVVMGAKTVFQDFAAWIEKPALPSRPLEHSFA